MADPTNKISGYVLHRITEGTVSVDDDPVVNLDTGGTEKIYLVNKGPNTVYFRTDGTTPTPGAAGNADYLKIDDAEFIEDAKIDDVKFLCDTGESAVVFYRLYT